MLKKFIRTTLNLLKLDLTKNLEYDRLTNLILKGAIKTNSNCIDVGCHKGEILEMILQLAPNGKHFGFEPIPMLADNLQKQFGSKATILQYALAETEGKTTFNFVKNAPAYSGLQKRKYDVAEPDIEVIDVEIRRLDDLIPSNTKIDVIKIDVEGAELGVLKGASKLILRDKPLLIFECGLGASDYYGTKPEHVYDFLNKEMGLKISTLKSYVNKSAVLSASQFEELYNSNKEYYFLAFA
ncbi:MAG: FkbM family methyltransferase [Bacteroidetes bacterium]|nr:FkbM family methyltransferase [Bacteroidota bacterium]